MISSLNNLLNNEGLSYSSLTLQASLVNILFKEKLTREKLVKEISCLSNPQVIFWYIGPYGLKEQGVHYYKKDLRKINNLSNNSECWLYDLTAWGAFKSSEKDLNAFDKNVRVIDEFAIERLHCLKSSEFF